MLAASEHLGPLRLFELNKPLKFLNTLPDDSYAIILTNNGKLTRQELYYGSSFLSQSSRFITVDKNVSKITIYSADGTARTIDRSQIKW